MATFDEAALFKLTAKIDSRLAEPQSKIAGNTSKKENSNKKRKQTTDQDAEPLKSPPNKRSRNEGKTSKDKPVTTKSKKTSANAKTKKPVDKSVDRDIKQDINVLLDEIKALGGSEEDLRLVEDIDSDEEEVVGNENDADAKLRAELARFAADLGFEKVAPDFAAAESGSEEQEDESRDEVDVPEDNNADHNNRSDQAPASAPDLNSRPRSLFKGKTIFEPRADWHAVPLNPLPKPSSDDVAPYMAAIAALKTYAKTLLDEDGEAYRTTVSSSSSHKFMSTIMSSGTMSDRVSALTLAIQESPVHSIKALESLMGFASKRSRDQALSALAALVDLLGPGMILPSDRRLHPFSSQVGLVGTLQNHRIKSWSVGQPLPGKITKEHLILWGFEDWLKDSYFKMIQSLETWCDDEVEYARTKAVDLVFALLRDKPEQESNLLRLLVNKLGDRERKIASRASYLLLQLLNVHPNMKMVVIQAVEQEVLFRPGQNVRAKYYTINTLNQTILSTKEPEIAENLLRIYFNLFVALLKNGELNQLDGPSSHGPKDKIKAKKNRQGGKSEWNGKDTKKGAAPPTDLEATEKLVSAILTGINRALPFSKADQSTVESHLNTLFRITHSSNFNTSIQALMLIQQLSASRQIATERFYRTLYESLLDPRLATSSKQALYLNLLYRSLKADIDVRRVKAFVKRMLQILNLQQPSFVCGILFLIIELSGVFPDLNTLFTEPEENDWEEVAQNAGATDAPAASTDPRSQDLRTPAMYDGRKRDPEYSNAHRSCLWELLPFLKHFHPSVEVYASNLLAGRRTTQKPELANHTLIAFLDKFVYRNAKTADSSRGISIMQPVAAGGQGHLVSNKPSAKDGASLNTSSFWNKKSEDVAKDEVFFHEYFAQIGKPRQAERAQKSKDAKAVSDDEDGEDGEEDIWNALVSSHPEVQGDLDSDPEFDDLMGLDDSDADFKAAMEDSDEEEGLDFLGESDISSDEEEEGGAELEPAVEEEKEEKSESQQKRAKRKAMKNLPTFASAEDYAEMLGQDDDEL